MKIRRAYASAMTTSCALQPHHLDRRTPTLPPPLQKSVPKRRLPGVDDRLRRQSRAERCLQPRERVRKNQREERTPGTSRLACAASTLLLRTLLLRRQEPQLTAQCRRRALGAPRHHGGEIQPVVHPVLPVSGNAGQ